MRRVSVDDVARDAANGGLSRRAIVGRLSYGAAAAGLAGLVGADRASAAGKVTCPPGLTNCGGVCRVLTIDPDHCGSCAHVCASNEICRGGVCTQLGACPSGQTNCGSGCVDLQTNPNHCGSCGHACATGEVCSAGVCGCASGSTRPCYSGPAGTAGVGACHAGTQTCVGGAWGACAGEVTPKAEICGNGIDDDCDGVIDNGCGPCTSCADCAGGQACINGACGACISDSDCCSPLVCVAGVCELVTPP
jgi:hypothetical protein